MASLDPPSRGCKSVNIVREFELYFRYVMVAFVKKCRHSPRMDPKQVILISLKYIFSKELGDISKIHFVVG